MRRQWWQEEVVYQIYPKSFYDSSGDGVGDLRGITEKLDYLEDLGITMIWICPMYQSPMDDNGYDISDYMGIAPEFGTMEDFDQLVREAERRKIKIMLDLVINHTSDEHRWFQRALEDPNSACHDYYIFKEGDREPNNWRSVFGGSVWEKIPGRDEYYFHSFGKKQPDLNWENPALREQLYEIVNWWLKKGIAGFRIDAITFVKKDLTWKSREADGADGLSKCTKSSRNQPGIGSFLHELRERTFDRYPCVTVAEAPGVAYGELGDFIGEEGYFSMIFDFRAADLDVASGSEWFKRVPWTVEDLREKIMTSQTEIQKYGWSANFIENHDQPRAASKYLREAQGNPEAVKTLGAMYFFLRGLPFIYQGQELGMVNFERKSIREFDDLSSTDQYRRAMEEGYSSEEALRFVNLRSRDNARTPFPWNKDRYGGFSRTKPWLGMTEEYPAVNAADQTGRPGSVLEFYREMIRFRQKGPCRECLIYGDIEPVDSSREVIAYRRYTEKETVYCWFNLGGRETEEKLPEVSAKLIWKTGGEVRIRGNRLLLEPYQSVMVRTS
ncbi:MAG: alpha-glucosidase [Hungatella sp.]|nr:alpha-glucosidase [Hungatella sp.]